VWNIYDNPYESIIIHFGFVVIEFLDNYLIPYYAFFIYIAYAQLHIFFKEIFVVLHLNNRIVCLCVFVSIPDNSSVLQRHIRTFKTTSSSSDCHNKIYPWCFHIRSPTDFISFTKSAKKQERLALVTWYAVFAVDLYQNYEK
jgi:hypothetical protein